MNSPKLVSVIVPTYNRAAMVQEALESIRRQTYQNVQIIVVDDGSTDETSAQMQSLPDILYIRQENQGQAAARNAGLAHAKGEYICTLDSDDIWQPDFLKTCVAALESLDADFVFANWISEDAQNNRYHSYWEKFYRWWDFPCTDHAGWRLMEAQPARDMYLDSCLSPSSALLFRRELVADGWTRRLNIGDDWCLILDIVLNRPCRVAFTMQRLWLKRVSGDNIYDQRDHYEVKVSLFLNDSHCLLQRFKGVLTRKERARFYGHLAFHRFGMAKHDLQSGRLHTVFLHTAYCLVNIGRGLITSPTDAWAKAKTNRWKMRPAFTAPTEELEHENFLPIESLYPLRNQVCHDTNDLTALMTKAN